MLLNCDLGEECAGAAGDIDAQVMPHIDQANIACGFHAGGPETMHKTLALAAQYAVAVGAHPSYQDREGFGRRSQSLSREALIAAVQYQMAALEGMALCHGLQPSHVKPHGALYNDMMRDPEVRAGVMQAVAGFHHSLPLVLQATPQAPLHEAEAAALGVQLQFEAFADRRYADDGRLLPRSEPGAVLSKAEVMDQVAQLKSDASVTTAGGESLPLAASTLCVHGDNAEGVAAISAIRKLLQRG
ncbi:MAG: 5-oxoprolinase subunit PxpA [Pseudomonadota bacterium]